MPKKSFFVIELRKKFLKLLTKSLEFLIGKNVKLSSRGWSTLFYLENDKIEEIHTQDICIC